MGWSGGNYVFDPVARKARELALTDEQKTGLLTVLIRELQDRDWDTEDESLEEFKDDQAIVEAFRRQEVILECSHSYGKGAATRWCERERGAIGHQDGQHEDADGVTWPVRTGARDEDAGAWR